ncbi:hypothetical protein AeRB84_010825 [Aphanomyces euteiches]|nr:hypothetical protein AeRB84_010825 [Aphanomyces euteiches]
MPSQYPCVVRTVSAQLLAPFAGGVVEVNRQIILDRVELQTTTGPLTLQNIEAWVVQDDSSDPRLILSRCVMQRLGYSLSELLTAARAKSHDWDCSTAWVQASSSVVDNFAHTRPMPTSSLSKDPAAAVHSIQMPVDTSLDELHHVDLPTIIPHDKDKVTSLIADRVAEAVEQGLPQDYVAPLQKLLTRHADVFRLGFGSDPPVKVPPLHVRLKPGVSPVRCSARRYPPAHQLFLEQHMAELEAAGLVYLNTTSRWATPPRIVPKQDGSYRMTVDTRAVNARTQPLQWPMPQLEVAMGAVVGSRYFFTLDWFRGYWQLPLGSTSQELFTIMTHRGMYTPTRVSMGGCDSVGYCQATVELIFSDLLYRGILAWIDDILGYASSMDDILSLLEKVLSTCAKVGLKLHPLKCSFFKRSAKWCGKIVSGNGIAHCPDRTAPIESQVLLTCRHRQLLANCKLSCAAQIGCARTSPLSLLWWPRSLNS